MLVQQSKRILYLYLAQNKRCYWCGRECLSPTLRHNAGQPFPLLGFSREHILPRSSNIKRRGKWWNIVGACYECNNRRQRINQPLPNPEAIRFARLTGIDPTGGQLTQWLQGGRR